MNVLERIKAAVREGRHRVTQHADEEAENDDFDLLDIKNALLNGQLIKRYGLDPRGIRYKLLGPALDRRMMYVVCRFDELDRLRVITVYEQGHER